MRYEQHHIIQIHESRQASNNARMNSSTSTSDKLCKWMMTCFKQASLQLNIYYHVVTEAIMALSGTARSKTPSKSSKLKWKAPTQKDIKNNIRKMLSGSTRCKHQARDQNWKSAKHRPNLWNSHSPHCGESQLPDAFKMLMQNWWLVLWWSAERSHRWLC